MKALRSPFVLHCSVSSTPVPKVVEHRNSEEPADAGLRVMSLTRP